MIDMAALLKKKLKRNSYARRFLYFFIILNASNRHLKYSSFIPSKSIVFQFGILSRNPLEENPDDLEKITALYNIQILP